MSVKKKQGALRYPTRMSMVLHFMRGSKRWFLFSVLSACVVSLLSLVNPQIIGFTVDSVIGNEQEDLPGWLRFFVSRAGGNERFRVHLWLIALLVAGIALVRALFRFLTEYCNSRGAERLVKTMRDDLFGHILRLPYSWHGEHATGDIIQRCTSDVDTVKTFLSDQLSALFQTVILLVLSLVFMFRIHTSLAAAAAVFIPIIVLYSLFFHSRIASSFEKADEEEGKLSTIAQENLTGVRVVRAFGREAYERDRFEEQNRIYTGYWVRLMKTLSLFWTTGDLAGYLQTLVILVYGSFLAISGQITAGNLITFISYNELLTWPVRALGRTIAEMSKTGISVDRLSMIMNAEEEKDLPGSVTPPMDGDIVFDHVSFQYENGTGEVLKDVSFTIRGGTVFGILGSTGSGKSTLMHLLDRLYDLPGEGEDAGGRSVSGENASSGTLSSGRISIGGTDISRIRRSYLREHIGMVLQEPYLFSRTLSENIAITRQKVSLPEVRRAAGIASLDETVQHFSKGYDTYVGERGVTLSGGQKQRTAIAQMLIRKPEIMIFDDSLSAVDAQTDAKIREALREKTAGSTVILISHRISTLREADSILVLDRGRVCAQGTHRELLETSPVYRRIYDLQQRGAEELEDAGAAGTPENAGKQGDPGAAGTPENAGTAGAPQGEAGREEPDRAAADACTAGPGKEEP